MADFTKSIVFVILHWIHQTQLVMANKPYCEFDSCKPDEYCCEPYKCCPKSDGRLYAILFVAGGFAALLFAYILYKYRYYLRRVFVTSPEEKPIIA